MFCADCTGCWGPITNNVGNSHGYLNSSPTTGICHCKTLYNLILPKKFLKPRTYKQFHTHTVPLKFVNNTKQKYLVDSSSLLFIYSHKITQTRLIQNNWNNFNENEKLCQNAKLWPNMHVKTWLIWRHRKSWKAAINEQLLRGFRIINWEITCGAGVASISPSCVRRFCLLFINAK